MLSPQEFRKRRARGSRTAGPAPCGSTPPVGEWVRKEGRGAATDRPSPPPPESENGGGENGGCSDSCCHSHTPLCPRPPIVVAARLGEVLSTPSPPPLEAWLGVAAAVGGEVGGRARRERPPQRSAPSFHLRPPFPHVTKAGEHVAEGECPFIETGTSSISLFIGFSGDCSHPLSK